jgi:site-specific recombinase XerD
MKTRNYLIVYMLVYTGVRVTELINIKVDDINDELIIKWKGWKYRPIKLFKDDLDLIKLYLFMRRKYKSDYLFISLSHNNMWEQISRVAVENIVRDGWIKAWIKTKIFPHKLRHTFATSLLRRNANLYHIKELLWHSSISTTQTYLSVVNSELAKTQSLLPRF